MHHVSVWRRTPQASGPPLLTNVANLGPAATGYYEDPLRGDPLAAISFPRSVFTTHPALRQLIREIADDDAPTPGTELTIDYVTDEPPYVATPMFHGRIVGPGMQGANDTWTLHATGLLSYTRGFVIGLETGAPNLLGRTFTAVDQYLIVKALIDEWQAQPWNDFGLDTSQLTTSGVLRDRQYLLGDRVHQRIMELASLAGDGNGFDIWIDYGPPTQAADGSRLQRNRTVLTAATRGTDRTASVVLDDRSVASPATYWSVNDGALASRTVAISADGSEVLAAAANNTGLLQSFGGYGYSAGHDGVTRLSTLQDHANAALAARALPGIESSPGLLPVPGAGTTDIWPGDLVSHVVDGGLGRIRITRRVASRRVEFGGRIDTVEVQLV